MTYYKYFENKFELVKFIMEKLTGDAMETYNEIMSDEEKKKAYLFYTELNNKNDIHFQIYTECSSTLNAYNKERFLMWHPMSLNTFLEIFNV